MANPTTNYGWPMPTSTDLVTDLPADFALFGQPVDTSLKALNPETTLGDIAYRSSTSNTNTRLGIGTAGQVLAVSGGVPAWTTTADVTPLTTKGDVFTFTTVDARLGVGANNTVLTADSAEATGLKWTTPSAGAVTQITTGTFTSVTSKSVDSCFTSTYKNYSVIIECATDGNTGTAVTFRYRASAADLSANSYYGGYYRIIQNGSTSTTYSNPATSVGISFVSSIATTAGSTINLTFNDPLAAGYGHPAVGTYFDSSQSNVPAIIGFEYLGSGTPDGFTIFCANAFSGSYKIYGWSN